MPQAWVLVSTSGCTHGVGGHPLPPHSPGLLPLCPCCLGRSALLGAFQIQGQRLALLHTPCLALCLSLAQPRGGFQGTWARKEGRSHSAAPTTGTVPRSLELGCPLSLWLGRGLMLRMASENCLKVALLGVTPQGHHKQDSCVGWGR